MIDSYDEFSVKNRTVGKLLVEREEFESPEWNIAIDLAGVWSGYTSGDIKAFNSSLASLFTGKADEITDACGPDAWADVSKVITGDLASAGTREESENAYNKLYDACDKHGIKLNQPNDDAIE